MCMLWGESDRAAVAFGEWKTRIIMSLAALAATVVLSSPHLSYHTYDADGDRLLATPRPWPANRADSIDRPGFNGREWVGTPIIGGAPRDWGHEWGVPGPSAYGASAHDHEVVWVRNHTQVIPISPWIRIPDEGLENFEQARIQWLKEHNYIGGVRTFTNESHHDDGRSVIRPRATIKIPDDMPRFRRHMDVRLDTPDFENAAHVRVSLPMHASADLRQAMARLETSDVRVADAD
ncbi:MAG: hypothetical protein KDA28_05955 [Phycisphaerales bacterium]|nr:hypothetical protein [Phycisphaerales bacterium]